VSHQLLHPRVKKAVELYNIEAKTIACDPELADTAAFCGHYGYRMDQSANTIIVASKTEEPVFVACLVLASTRLDVNKKVRQLVGTRKLSFASADQTKELTGMLIGGVTVIGLPADLPLYVDSTVMDVDEIIVGGGNRSSKLVIKPAELSKLPNFAIIEGLAIARP
jgi:prolyl-tRNA editing enzyme YbaK/EbsC (Cys-tRNA(Pro) deacylase)